MEKEVKTNCFNLSAGLPKDMSPGTFDDSMTGHCYEESYISKGAYFHQIQSPTTLEPCNNEGKQGTIPNLQQSIPPQMM